MGTETQGGIHSPFRPSNTVMAQMDAMAQQVWSACMHDDKYRVLFKDADSIAPGADGNVVQAFRSRYFTAMKMAPDLAANISKMNGLPICSMTSQTYVVPSGLKAEIQKLVNAFTSDEYNLPLSAS